MNSFKDVVKAVQNVAPTLDYVHSKWYIVNQNPHLQLKVSKPCPFDSYLDIVARVTLFNDNEVLFDALITVDADLNALCAKLKKKIETSEIKKG